MSTEIILITAFVIITFLFLQIVKVRKPEAQSVENENDSLSSEPETVEDTEISELHENATLK